MRAHISLDTRQKTLSPASIWKRINLAERSSHNSHWHNFHAVTPRRLGRGRIHDSARDRESGNNVWKVPINESSSAYWDLYLSTRPPYTRSFFEKMFGYHERHSQSFLTAVDVGGGVGQAVPKLARRFSHVITSDINANHVEEARRRLERTILPRGKGVLDPDSRQTEVSFVVCSGEDLAERFPDQSVDFIGVAECLPLMNTDLAIRSFTKILRPNGTLAIWFYGRPRFVGGDPATRCQHFLGRLLDLSFQKTVLVEEVDETARLARREAWRKALRGMKSWLDDVHLPEDWWIDVERTKWNTHAEMPFFREEACGYDPLELVTSISTHEGTVEIKDESFWKVEWNFDQLRNFVMGSFPGLWDQQRGDSDIQDNFRLLESAMEGDKVWTLTWPVVLILARRKPA